MGTPPPAPQGDAVPTDVPFNSSPSNGSSDSTGKRKKIAIIAGSGLGVILIVLAVLFFLPKEELPVAPDKPVVSVADYIKGKRFTYSLPEEAVDGLIPTNLVAVLGGQINSIKAQLSSQPVFMQFGTNNVVEYGTAIGGSVSKIAQGTYSVDGLSVVLKKDGGNDTVVFNKAKPGIGDDFKMKFISGNAVKIKITNVEPGEPLQSMNMTMMGNLGLGGDGGLGALAGLLPGKGGGTGRPEKPKPKPGYQQQSGAGGPQGKPQQAPGKARRWTFGHGQMDISKWKGKGTDQQVIQTFGQPDNAKTWGQGGGAWTYNKMKITDAAGKTHRSIIFYVQNGVVVDVKLPVAGGAGSVN